MDRRLLTDDEVLASLGSRLARARVRRNLTQQELAVEAGVGKTTVERVETGKSVTLANLVRVLRALDLLDALLDVAPEATLQPVELAKRAERERRRASKPRSAGPTDRSTPFTWGDERR